MNQQLEAAEEMLKKMANENPIDARIQMALGAIHAMRGEKEAALMRGKQAIALYPLDKKQDHYPAGPHRLREDLPETRDEGRVHRRTRDTQGQAAGDGG